MKERQLGDSPLLIRDDVVADSVIAGIHEDEFDHTAIASRVGELIAVVDPPMNIALFGPWGSGKSSFFALLKQTVEKQDKSARVVRYDAWKFGGDALKRNFITALAKELKLDGEKYSRKLYESTKTVRLDLKAFLESNWKQLLLLAVLALAVSIVWALVAAAPSLIALTTKGAQPDAYWAAFGRVLATSISTVGLIFAAIFVGIKAFESANVSVESSAANSDEQFVEAFRELIEDALKPDVFARRGTRRLVIYIDELDRCSPKDVVSTLVSLKTFLDERGCIFVVAADREVLEAALDDELEHKVPFRIEEPYYSTAGAFLDKIFQHQIALPPLRQRALTKFARALVIDSGGIWEDLRDRPASKNDFESVVYTLIPAHVRSPRRVKVLLNNFALNVRVVQSRGLRWKERACQIAALTVLQTEFPAVASAMVHEPRLLERIRRVRQQSGNTVEETVERLITSTPSKGEQSVEHPGVELDDSAAGRLLGRENAGAGADVLKVRARLTDQLNRYLRRISDLGVPDPTPDLIFMQPLGELETLENPEVGAVIDAAPDESAATTIARLEVESIADKQTALTVLAGESETTFGPSRANLVEVICGVAAGMPSGALAAVSGSVLPAVKAAAAESKSPVRWLPGAIALASSVGDETAVGAWIVDLGSDPQDVLPLLGQVYRLEGPGQDGALESIGRAGLKDSVLFVDAFNELEPLTARRFLETQYHFIQEYLSNLETTDTYEELLQAVRERDDLDPAVLNRLIELGLSSENVSVLEAAKKQAFDQVQADPAARLAPSLALSAVGRAGASELTKWAEIPSGEAGAQTIEQAVVHIFDLLKEELSEADQMSAARSILARVAELRVDGDIDARVIAAAAEACLGERRWAAEPQVVGSGLYAAALAAAPLIGRAPMVELLVSDFVSEVVGLGSQETVSVALAVAQELPSDVAAAVSGRMAKTSLSAVDSSVVVRIYLKLATAAKTRTGLAFDAIGPLVPTPSGKATYQEWVACGPTLNDVFRAIPVAGLPTAQSIRELGKWLTDEERGQLWIKIRQTPGHTFQHLYAAAARGVSVAAVKFNERALGAARASKRADAVKILLTLPLNKPSDVQRAASEIVLRFLAKDQKADTELAIKVLVHAGGAGYRYKTPLRKALEKAERSHPRAFRESDHVKLSELGLL